MGHTEMLLAVAGLDQDALDDRAGRLASGDWSTFPAADRAAFHFARTLSIAPWTVGDAEFHGLVDHFGTKRTLDLVWWASRCHYMTRVADAFQIPLELDNVFAAPTR